MGTRFISAIDYGPGNNDKYPRWAVYENYFIWAGHHGNRKVAGPFWTEAEARKWLDQYEAADTMSKVMLAVLLLAVIGAILVFGL